MSTMSRIVLGAMGRLRPRPLSGAAAPAISLPQPDISDGMGLMKALSQRRSSREFSPQALALPMLSNLLWAAFGVNREDGGRTAPSALNGQEIEVYIALPDGAYRYQ